MRKWQTVVHTGRPGASGSVSSCGDRATGPVEDIWCETIRSCSCTETVCPFRYADADRVLQGDELRKKHTPWCRQAVKVASV